MLFEKKVYSLKFVFFHLYIMCEGISLSESSIVVEAIETVLFSKVFKFRLLEVSTDNGD